MLIIRVKLHFDHQMSNRQLLVLLASANFSFLLYAYTLVLMCICECVCIYFRAVAVEDNFLDVK